MKRAFIRLLRGIVSIGIAGTIATFQNQPYWIVLTPVINAVGKYLRDKLGINYIPF